MKFVENAFSPDECIWAMINRMEGVPGAMNNNFTSVLQGSP